MRRQWEEEGSRSFEEIFAFLRCERKLRTGMGSEGGYDFLRKFPALFSPLEIPPWKAPKEHKHRVDEHTVGKYPGCTSQETLR